MFKDKASVPTGLISHENKKTTVTDGHTGHYSIKGITHNTSKVLSDAFNGTCENRSDTTSETNRPERDNFDDLSNYLIFNESKSSCNLKDEGISEKLAKESQIKPNSGSENIFNPLKETEYVWKPGFCLQLGSKGRKAMLKLLRNAYKSNKNFKRVFEKKNPPTTISNLPFFRVSMLWELAHDLNVFDEAILIHKCFGKVKNKTRSPIRNACETFNNATKDELNGNLIKGTEKCGNHLHYESECILSTETIPNQMLSKVHDIGITYLHNCNNQHTDKIEDKAPEISQIKHTNDFDPDEHDILFKRVFQLDSSTLKLSTSPSSLSTEVTSLNDGQTNEDENLLPNDSEQFDTLAGMSIPLGLLKDGENILSGQKCHEDEKVQNVQTRRANDTTREEFGKLALYLSREYKFLNADKSS
ncbi:hypothetical protein BEWA_032240 [Theileria equi strain WA]|uniref:Uncharacterized protein n=1 Tax=Theileria equi strain WA TaxID=1537102 RepID=L0AZD4_THEEQ|nr:hypothetical protein BEWA_032240 [Theileria equi strain WA]AFZ80371.1 hypothetical protein BEWA_032240 [Theileria equi strain WA]|eukprot:XP_004830037.1 hypothetical protein BEWA_032240 [Theileria equi strain WA]